MIKNTAKGGKVMKTITIARIVAATDFSAAAERAVRRGALIAKQLGAELHLLHVVYPLDLYPGLMLAFDSRQTELERLRQETGKTRLDTMAEALQQEYGVRIKTATRIGRAHTQIAEYAVAHAAGLLVVGARGENTMLDLLLGSTASRLLRVATCPVLIVRNAEAVPYRQAIAAVDFPEGSAAVPTFARTVAPNARIEVLHIFDLVQEARMREIGLDDARLQKYRDDALAQVKTQSHDPPGFVRLSAGGNLRPCRHVARRFDCPGQARQERFAGVPAGHRQQGRGQRGRLRRAIDRLTWAP
jgi:nucleotide-binding universal stress UspA family protein